ncbi:hypothetical protein LTV02_03870 [Nocardia yamanashiensis]|uniref:AfsA-related hotdog domain-containing protein n=1 Tax=Nocardia yamanashiensis TaxID=209247 RepID=UPI001E296964|nr:AfsA-related hotdog domain-containing protein [Nocardia yamanashiensis]UGT42568.1 hypothetical protein LTV02_03870 [Nocardia yamanashiensis]
MTVQADTTTLSFEQTVPRQLAHRRNLGEVLIADSVRSGDGEFLVAFQVPRAHLVWADRPAERHDTFAVAEAARQAAFVVLHRHLEIPIGLPFTMHGFDFEVDRPELFADDHRNALEGVLHYRIINWDKRSASQGGLKFAGVAAIGGQAALTFSGDVVFLPADDYQALRDFQRRRRPAASAVVPIPLSPTLVGRSDRRNVVLGEPHDLTATGGRFPIVIDRSHPSFFDHEYDHVPGPLCIEAFRQAVIATGHRLGLLSEQSVTTVVAATAKFEDFGELDASLECEVEFEASSADRIRAVVGLHQFGKSIAAGGLVLLHSDEKAHNIRL